MLKILALVAIFAGGCSREAAQAPTGAMAGKTADRVESKAREEVAASAAPKAKKVMRRLADSKGDMAPSVAAKPSDKEDDNGAVSEGKPAEVKTRAWFPETFLFAPLVVTDAAGKATVSVRVPDRLTRWRVLALAHNRSGAQAGHLSSFAGTLPVYVEPILPPSLRVGDEIMLPIKVVNTTDIDVEETLKVTAHGLQSRGIDEALVVPALGSTIRYLKLKANRVGHGKILAKLGTTDAIVKTLEIVPTGRPLIQTRKGTLAAPRRIVFKGHPKANRSLGKVRLRVFAGALALLRSELGAAASRGGGVAENAFSLWLAAKAERLIRALGGKDLMGKNAGPGVQSANASALRDLQVVSTQRLLRQSRHLTMDSATLIAEGTAGHGQNPILSRLASRSVEFIRRKQAPDGTCGGETGWSLQRLLVATAQCVNAARDEKRVRARAKVAFARQVARVKDAYTAAMVLGTGLVDGDLHQRLLDIVLKAIHRRKDGSKVLKIPRDIRRADGRRPSVAEATAVAILALRGQPKAPIADLGAAVLGAYEPGLGWGDGRANLSAFRAILEVFNKPFPREIQILLRRDGEVVAQKHLRGNAPQEAVVLDAAIWKASTHKANARAAAQRWDVVAVPPVPGFGFSLSHQEWIPWPKSPPKRGGVELSVLLPKGLQVGKRSKLRMRAIAPAARALTLKLQLPAGVQAERRQLQGWVKRGVLRSFQLDDSRLTMELAPLAPAKPFRAALDIIPTFSGKVQSGPSSLQLSGQRVALAPVFWNVAAMGAPGR